MKNNISVSQRHQELSICPRHYCLCSLLLMASMLFSTIIMAETPFRKYRAAHLESLRVDSTNIVFVGNSLTNGNNWAEFWGNPKVVNRGVSGARSYEVKAHLTGYLGKGPAKVFLLIGTNDLSEGKSVADIMENIRSICHYISFAMPRTKLYVMSVFPTDKPYRSKVPMLNGAIEAYTQQAGYQYIDVYSRLKTPEGGINSEYSNDGLHLTGLGYQVVAKVLKPYMGHCAARKTRQTMIAGVSHPYVNQRSMLFATLPLHREDVLMFGGMDYNTAEWHELTGNPHIKNRGIGVGSTSNLRLGDAIKVVPFMLKKKKSPAKIYISLGREELLTLHEVPDSILKSYEKLMYTIRRLSPKTTVCMQSLLPCKDAKTNREVIMPFNRSLSALSRQLQTEYIDVFPYFTDPDGTPHPSLFNDGWLSPAGFRTLADILFKK